MGAEFKVSYKEELSRVSYWLRNEYVEWSARLGRQHWDKWYWWLTHLAARNNLTSKLYLYLCYMEVLKTILAKGCGTLIIISNSWELLDTIEKRYKEKTDILKPYIPEYVIRRMSSYVKEKIFFIMAWGLFFQKSIYGWAASRITRSTDHPRKDHVYRKDHIVIHTCIDDSCIGDDGRFRDRYYPGLADYIRSKGKKVSTLIWLYNIEDKNLFNVFSWFRHSEESFLIPQDYYNLLDCLYAFFVIVRSSMLNLYGKEAYFKDTDVSSLIRYEQVLQARNTGSAYFINQIKMFAKWKGLGYKLGAYIDTWELKNCEVAAIVGIRRYYPDCKIVAYQHGALMPKMLFSNYKTTPEEFNASPHPDVGIVNCRKNMDFLCMEGFPEFFIKPGPALRYMWHKKYAMPENDVKDREGILVCLSLSYDISSEIMETVYKVFSERPDYKIWVKVHPMMKLGKLKKRLSFSWPSNYIQAEGNIDIWIKRARAVITSQSSSMVDAVYAGVKTIIIGRQTDIDIIPLDILENCKGWEIVHSHKELSKAVHNSRVSDKTSSDSKNDVFFEFRMELLNEIMQLQ